MKATGIKTLASSIAALTASFSMLVGSTFAWFTDSSNSAINTIQSGNLDVGFVYSNSYNGTPEEVNEQTKIFTDINGEDILWEPGVFASGRFKVSNNGDLALKYQLSIISANATQIESGKTLEDVLTIYALTRNKETGPDGVMEDQSLEELQIDSAVPAYDPMNMPSFKNGFCLEAYLLPQESITYEIGIFWEPTENDNEFNVKGGLSIDFAACLLATQMSYESDGDGFYYDTQSAFPEAPAIPDKWDGSSSIEWYLQNPNAQEFAISSAEDLAGLVALVDGGNDFVGKTIKLDGDLDLGATDENGNRVQFNPIGHSSNDKAFKGTFDGQGHTICNLYQQSDLGAWQYEGEYYGLFAYTNGATIKNVNVDGAYISSGRNEAASVVGNAVDTTFENINIANTTLIAYNNSAGGVAAECYGNCSFTNITVDENTVVGPLWGTYDVRLGGIVGLVHAGNNVTFKDITVACKLDAINDVAANYQYWQYRYCGMLIGNVDSVNGVADPTGYVTCENVKVIYGDWVNYHYCEDADLGAGSYNGPGEYKYARVEAGTGTDGIDLSSCNHNEDESHNVLIVFDQLFGGGQGIAGMKTYDGVEVVYKQ